MNDLLNMDRRSMVQRMAFLLGAAALPSNVFANSARRAKRFLPAAQMVLLGAVADTIIPKTDTPGAVEAGVPAKLDAMLTSWASPERRIDLSRALADIDRASQAQHGKGFADLTPNVRFALLSAHDAASLKQVPDTRNLSGMAALMAGPSIADPGYAKLRELVILLYYYSETALTTELPYEHVPGNWTPSIKVTSETRAPGGIGMY